MTGASPILDMILPDLIKISPEAIIRRATLIAISRDQEMKALHE
jgi:hypothetical protein